MAFVANYVGYAVLPIWAATRQRREIPFLDGNFVSAFCFVSVALAVALGLRQTAVESRRGTWLFLLHRPASLWRVLAAKLAVGGGLYLVCGLIADLVLRCLGGYAGQARQPVPVVDDGGRLEGLGPDSHRLPGRLPGGDCGRRAGSARGCLPLAAGGRPRRLADVLPMFWPLLGIAVFLLVAACLVGLIHFTARTRDFS